MNRLKKYLLRYLLNELTEIGRKKHDNQLIDCIIVIQDELGWNDNA